MTWNHRVVRSEIFGEFSYGIHEVNYNEDGSFLSMTRDPIHLYDSTWSELFDVWMVMALAFDKPTIDEAGNEVRMADDLDPHIKKLALEVRERWINDNSEFDGDDAKSPVNE